MDTINKYIYWEEAARYDFETAEAMLHTSRYLYVVFMCQQTIEKLVKGLYILHNGEEPPRTHNILYLFKLINWTIDTEDFKIKSEKYSSFFTKLLSYYISGRYPTYKEKLSNTLDEKEAKEIFENCKEVFSWLISLKGF